MWTTEQWGNMRERKIQYFSCIYSAHARSHYSHVRKSSVSDLQKDYWRIVLLHFNSGSKAFLSPFGLFLLLNFLLECSVTAELVAKRHIFKVTCGTAVSGVPIYTLVAQTQCFENPALRGGRRRNSSERACKGKNMNLDIGTTPKLILDFFH